jgi:hypothetical protein
VSDPGLIAAIGAFSTVLVAIIGLFAARYTWPRKGRHDDGGERVIINIDTPRLLNTEPNGPTRKWPPSLAPTPRLLPDPSAAAELPAGVDRIIAGPTDGVAPTADKAQNSASISSSRFDEMTKEEALVTFILEIQEQLSPGGRFQFKSAMTKNQSQ